MAIAKLLFFALFTSGAFLFFSLNSRLRIVTQPKFIKERLYRALTFISFQAIFFSLVFLITRSVNISLPVSIILSYIPRIYKKSKERKEDEARRKSWPLVIDQLSTATASGVSLQQALSEMVTRGPLALQDEFQTFKNSFASSGSLTIALNDFVSAASLREAKSHYRMAAQLKSTILIARDCGGQEIGPILRNLSMHLRQRERAFDEIAIRQNWIKNGAALAALTPWLLLLVLSLHSQTIDAYNSNAGRTVLIVGLIATGLAYKWIYYISESLSSGKRSN